MISRFDTVVISFLLTVLALISLVIWRGDQLDFAIVNTFPHSSAASSASTIGIIFESPITFYEDVEVELEPAVSGELTVTGNQLIFKPSEPLAEQTRYAVTVRGTIQNEQGRGFDAPIQWEFQTGEPRILFISWEGEDEPNQIFQITVADPTPVKLTDVMHEVLDFSVSPDGSEILFSHFRPEDGGSDFWLMNVDGSEQRLFLNCENATCRQAIWVPNSNLVIYERRTIPSPDAPPGLPRLWWLDMRTAETVPLFEDSQLLGHGASVSTDGRLLSFISPTQQGIQVYDLQDGSGFFVPNRMGSPAQWNPLDNTLLVNELQEEGEAGWEVHLLSIDIETETVESISDGVPMAVDDSTPTFSPSGMLVALGRKEPRTPMGRQLWLMNVDGSEAVALTGEPDTHYGPFAWSPNGRYILMQQYQLKEQFAQPTLMLYDLETDTIQELTSPVVLPFAWIP